MKAYKLSLEDINNFLENLQCDSGGIKIMSKKAKVHTLFIKNLHVGAANILKQDALSIGADLAVPRGVIIAKEKYVDALLIGTTKHFETLARKELAQPFGLKELAKVLKDFVKEQKYSTKIMGVLNANEDSFFKNSRFDNSQASFKIEKMIEDGANIIDIGAVSSRPGSLPVSSDEELNRIKDIVQTIYKNRYFEKVDFSIDSYEPKVIEYVLDHGFKIVNDITGLENDEVCKLTAKYSAQAVIMHMQNNQTNMQEDPFYEDVIVEIDDFFKQRVEKAKSFGVEDIVLDVGIGFGKTLKHNLLLLKNLEHFKHFGYELLIGASRKSMINMITPTEVSDRLPGTLSIHLESLRNGASIIRCHDVKEHFQAIKVFEAIQNIN
ncbi:dihydropteroate synthase [Aliarcobacter skirrowii]|jgi:dihydropteroate synthase|uniref:dihydropteroate synthase n=1 Tax=Aliarcobacter skirrowii CCUG 10374 TaxID=1032239 RepID=A0AAD0SLB4_9BACT|nr:dihydropteroate synthase [Aliarcobacter skirrowii]AXX84861.1 dihydropteroate synthase [Aliarcobacter skirrowii CCUG 10374]KAB0620437.1 dihydropteroate synthase [Aliarcobacter skirrowii CCUG 10374]MDY0180761.1 dihydropteroate synthase [Aliarcobacter skirrowii]RXI25628.1 dihydropteroate synthase [Aliarcobacter skirrowii CCUG 10374]SUU96616.1 Dihydropteroate synthase [Aliarcobacter skirrowii]